MKPGQLIESIFIQAEQAGIDRATLMRRAGLLQPSVSRAMNADDCRLSTLNKLLQAAGMRLVVVPDNAIAEGLSKGNIFG